MGIGTYFPAVIAVDASLDEARRSKIRPWYLSIIVECKDVGPKKLPTPEGVTVLESEERDFEQRLCAEGNARLLALLTWNGTRQLLYRVRDPELANDAIPQAYNPPLMSAFCASVVDGGGAAVPCAVSSGGSVPLR